MSECYCEDCKRVMVEPDDWFHGFDSMKCLQCGCAATLGITSDQIKIARAFDCPKINSIYGVIQAAKKCRNMTLAHDLQGFNYDEILGWFPTFDEVTPCNHRWCEHETWHSFDAETGASAAPHCIDCGMEEYQLPETKFCVKCETKKCEHNYPEPLNYCRQCGEYKP